MATNGNSPFRRRIRVSPSVVRGEVRWKVDLRFIGQGRKFFQEESEAHRYAESLEEEIWKFGVDFSIPEHHRADAAKALRLLAGASDLTEAARFYLKHNRDLRPKKIREAYEEFIDYKASKPFCKDYVRCLKIRIPTFLEFAPEYFSDFDSLCVIEWVESLKKAPKTVKNYCDAVKTFLTWSVSRKYLSKKWDGWNHLRVRVPAKSSIDLFTPEEFKKILAVTPERMLPFMVIGAFAGLRNAEIRRLNWADIGPKYIEVNAESSKVGTRRLVEISPNLRIWLDSLQSFGNVLNVDPDDYFKRIGDNAGIKWRRNALRHSWISYRLALVQDAGKVAYEGNNSPTVIFRNYREVVTPEDANRWFKITPSSVNCQSDSGLKAI